MRIAYLVTHPIQYQAPLLRQIAAESDIELMVFFASDVTLRRFLAPGFETSIRWDVPLLGGYEYELLPAFGSRDRISFWQPMNHGLGRRLRAGRFDALWIHGYMRVQHWSAMIAARRLGLKVLVRDEATAISGVRGRLNKTLKRPFFSWLGRMVDRFFAIGSLNRSYYLQYGIPEARIFSMPYAVDNAFFQAQVTECASQRETLRSSLGLECGRPIILYAGKMIERKRPNDLLEAYLRLSLNGSCEPIPYLLYVGDGELRCQLEKRAAATGWRSIKFVGFRNQTEMPAFYDLCDVFVMPSAIEPWGLVVNEAMNAKKPVIISDQVGCAPDLVRERENGFVFRAGDVVDLMRALQTVVAEPGRCVAMGQKSYQIINSWSFNEDVQGLRAALDL